MGASLTILVRLAGLEPAAYGLGIHRSIRLSYTHHIRLASPAGFEPATDGLEIRCSIQLSYGPMVGASGFEPPISWSQTMRVTKLRHTPSRKRIHAISQKSRSQRYGPLEENTTKPQRPVLGD